MKENFDVVVIGAGPGGYVAAIRLAQLGKKVCIVEKEHLGGICLNWGCIPTKALLHTAEFYHECKNAEKKGIKIEGLSFDFEAIIAKSRKATNDLTAGIKGLMKKNNIKVIMGHAKINKDYDIAIDDKEVITAEKIIIATGARARILPNFEPDGKIIWSYKEAMTPKSLPKSIIVVGGGVIGMEFASFYNMMGSKVTVIEGQNSILVNEDADITKLATNEFTKSGIEIITNAKLTRLTKSDSKASLEIEINGAKKSLEADNVLMAVGVVANVENLGLENTKVKIDRNAIVTNQFCKTDDDKIYAIGDVASAPWLAHKASHEGIIAAEHIAQMKVHGIDKHNIPGCIYSHPQMASVGFTEEAAIKAGYSLKIGRFPLAANGKSVATGDNFGMIKTIFDEKTGELLGAHMIGHNVTELISNFVIAKTAELTEEELIHTIFAHPTVSEALHESILNAYGRAIHI